MAGTTALLLVFGLLAFAEAEESSQIELLARCNPKGQISIEQDQRYEVIGSASIPLLEQIGLAYSVASVKGHRLRQSTNYYLLIYLNETKGRTELVMPLLASVSVHPEVSQLLDCHIIGLDIMRVALLIAGAVIVVAAPTLGSCLRIRSVFLGLTFIFSAAIAVVVVLYYTYQSVGADARNLALGATMPFAMVGLAKMAGIDLEMKHLMGRDLVPPYQNWVVALAVLLLLIAVLTATVMTSCVTKEVVQRGSYALETAMMVSGLAMAACSSYLLVLNVTIGVLLVVIYLGMSWTCFRQSDGNVLAPSAPLRPDEGEGGRHHQHQD